VALQCVCDLIPQFLPPGSREYLAALPPSMPGFSSNIISAASSISSAVSDQPRLVLCTSLARFVRGACVKQPSAQAEAAWHCGTHALLLATHSPLLLQAGGERWDALVNVFVRVCLQQLCNMLAGPSSSYGAQVNTAEALLWDTAFPAVLVGALGTAGMRSDRSMAANATAALFSFLRREQRSAAEAKATGGQVAEDPAATSTAAMHPRLQATASHTEVMQSLLRVVAPKNTMGEGDGTEHITEHPAFDWVSLAFELFLEHGLLGTAHAALGTPAGTAASGDPPAPPPLTLDHVVFVSLLDAVLYTQGIGSSSMSQQDAAALSGHLRSIMTPLAAGTPPPLPVKSLAELQAPVLETDASAAVASSVAVQHTHTLVRLLGQRAQDESQQLDSSSDTPPGLPFMAAELAVLGPWAAIGDRTSRGPSSAGAPTSPADTPPPRCSRAWIPHSYVSDLLQSTANVSFRHRAAVQCVLATPGALESALSHCKMSDSQPMQREWALMLVRNLCEVAPSAQIRISELKARGVTRTAELEQAGVRPVFDPATGKVKLTTAGGRAYVPPPAQAGAAAGAGGGESRLGGRAMELAGAEGAAAMMGISVQELTDADAGEGVFHQEHPGTMQPSDTATRAAARLLDGDFM